MTSFPEVARHWVSWMWAASWQLAVLVAVIAPIAYAMRALPAKVRHTMWLLVIVKAVLPPNLAAPGAVGDWGVDSLRTSAPGMLDIVADPIRGLHTALAFDPEVGVLAGRGGHLSLGPMNAMAAAVFGVLFICWMVGTVVFFAGVAWQQMMLARSLHCSRAVSDGSLHRELLSLAGRIGLKRVPELVLAADATGPYLCGLTRPRIVIPAGLPGELSVEQMRAVLLHELIHYKRGDLATAWLQVVVQGAFWFHPLVWMANRAIAAEREYCVDEAVVGGARFDVFAYGRSLIRVLEAGARGTSAALAFLGADSASREIEKRILRLVNMRPLPRAIMAGAWCFVAVFAFEFLPMAEPARAVPHNPSPTVIHTTQQPGTIPLPVK